MPYLETWDITNHGALLGYPTEPRMGLTRTAVRLLFGAGPFPMSRLRDFYIAFTEAIEAKNFEFTVTGVDGIPVPLKVYIARPPRGGEAIMVMLKDEDKLSTEMPMPSGDA